MSITREQDEKERKVAKICLVVEPVAMMIICAFVLLDMAPGLDAGHPKEYLVATCVLWAIVIAVLPILRLKRLVQLPNWLKFTIDANMFFYVLGLNLGFYLDISWWGDMGHYISAMVVAGIVISALALIEKHSPAHVTLGNRGGFCFITFFIAVSFGGIWEIMEASTDIIAGSSYMVYGANDTLGDLVADTCGVLTIAVYTYYYLGSHTTEEFASSIRFGKKAFRISDDE